MSASIEPLPRDADVNVIENMFQQKVMSEIAQMGPSPTKASPDGVSVFDTMLSQSESNFTSTSSAFEKVFGAQSELPVRMDNMLNVDNPELWIDDVNGVFDDEFMFDFGPDVDIFADAANSHVPISTKPAPLEEMKSFWLQTKAKVDPGKTCFERSTQVFQIQLECSTSNSPGYFIEVPIYSLKNSRGSPLKGFASTAQDADTKRGEQQAPGSAPNKRTLSKRVKALDNTTRLRRSKACSKRSARSTAILDKTLSQEDYKHLSKEKRTTRIKHHRESRKRRLKVHYGMKKKKVMYDVRRRIAIQALRGSSGKYKGRFAKSVDDEPKQTTVM